MPEPVKKKRFALPREVRIILSVGALVFVFEYLVLPQFSSARKSLHLLATVNPVLVIARALRVAAIYAYVELTKHRALPLRPESLQLVAGESRGPRDQSRRARRHGPGRRAGLPDLQRARRPRRRPTRSASPSRAPARPSS